MWPEEISFSTFSSLPTCREGNAGKLVIIILGILGGALLVLVLVFVAVVVCLLLCLFETNKGSSLYFTHYGAQAGLKLMNAGIKLFFKCFFFPSLLCFTIELLIGFQTSQKHIFAPKLLIN